MVHISITAPTLSEAKTASKWIVGAMEADDYVLRKFEARRVDGDQREITVTMEKEEG